MQRRLRMRHETSALLFHVSRFQRLMRRNERRNRQYFQCRYVERVKGIEPSYSAWKAAALPLSYTRARRTMLWRKGHCNRAKNRAYAKYTGSNMRQTAFAYGLFCVAFAAAPGAARSADGTDTVIRTTVIIRANAGECPPDFTIFRMEAGKKLPAASKICFVRPAKPANK